MTTWQDSTNGIYELVGGLLMAMNCVRAYKDKEIKGISLVPAAFFTSWGYWNLYYYPHLNQWMSTIGAVVMTLCNSVWMGQALYYTFYYQPRQKKWKADAEDAYGQLFGEKPKRPWPPELQEQIDQTQAMGRALQKEAHELQNTTRSNRSV